MNRGIGLVALIFFVLELSGCASFSVEYEEKEDVSRWMVKVTTPPFSRTNIEDLASRMVSVWNEDGSGRLEIGSDLKGAEFNNAGQLEVVKALLDAALQAASASGGGGGGSSALPPPEE